MAYRDLQEKAKLTLKQTIDEMLKEYGAQWDGEITFFDDTPSLELGDFGTAVAFQLARVFRKAPKLIAEELVERIEKPEGIVEVKAVNGYINFYVDYSYFGRELVREILGTKAKPTARAKSEGVKRSSSSTLQSIRPNRSTWGTRGTRFWATRWRG